MAIGLLAMVTGLVVAIVFIPETMSPPPTRKILSEEEDQRAPVDGGRRSGKTAIIRQRLREHVKKSLKVVQWLMSNARLVLVALCFTLFHLGEQADVLLMLQYVAKRLGWTIGRVSSPIRDMSKSKHMDIDCDDNRPPSLAASVLRSTSSSSPFSSRPFLPSSWVKWTCTKWSKTNASHSSAAFSS